ncbi:MAG: glycosyltransferase family 4 protein [Acidimicrobiales bacterium]
MVLHHLPAPGAGGLEGQVHDLCAGLLARGIDVRVVCRPSLYLPAATVPLLERVTAFPADRPTASPDTAFLETWRTSQELAEAEELTTYDIVHVQSHYGYHTALHVAGTPGPRPALVTTFHLTALGGMLRLQELGLPQEPDIAMTQPAAVTEATLARVSDHCIAVSDQVRNDLSRGYGAAQERISVVYNGVDTDLFTPLSRGQARRKLGLDPTLRYVLYVGPFFGFRGRTLLDSLPLLDADVRVLAIWPSSESEPPSPVGGRLIRVGYVPREEMPIYYAAAELLAYPLVYTGFGLTLLEASACGCVPVAFDLPPPNELLPDTAWLVDEITPRAFAHAINAALRNPDTARKARNGIRRARTPQFSRDHMINQTLAAYDTALQSVHRDDDR